MPIEYTRQEILEAIKSGMSDYLEMARIGVRQRWKGLSQSEKWAAGRALVAWSDVAKNPAKYFSRAATSNSWNSRAEQYYQEHSKDMPNVHFAYYIVPDPTGIVWNQVQAAFAYNPELGKKFSRFCNLVQKWEYARTARENAEHGVAALYGNDIVKMSLAVRKILNLKKSNPMIRPIKEMFHSLQK